MRRGQFPLAIVLPLLLLSPSHSIAWGQQRSPPPPPADGRGPADVLDAPLTPTEQAGSFDPAATPDRLWACERLREAGDKARPATPALARMLAVAPIAPTAASVLDELAGGPRS